MATTKKYVSLDKLSLYDEKIKAHLASADAQVLADSKSYADSLADNYEAAGSVATAQEALQKDIDAAKSAADAADAKAVAAQGEVDALELVVADKADASALDELEAYVGTIPEGYTETNVVAYVNKRAEEVLSQASGGSSESAASVLAALNTYKSENDPKVTKNTEDIAELQTAVEGAQSAADAVDARVDILVGEDANKSVRTIANEELAAQLIAEGAAESLDTLQEIAAWIQAHPEDAAAMNQAITALEGFVGELPEGVTATTIVGYIQEVVAAEKSRAEQAEADLDGRIDLIEAELAGEGEGTVDERINAAKQAAIDAAAADAAAKDAALETSVKKYTDDAVAVEKARVDALESKAHEHANKELLDSYTQTEENLADAVAKKHEHANIDVLNGVTAEKVTLWDGVSSKAAQTDLDAAVARIAANESAIAAFVEVSEEEINALFETQSA